MDSSRRITKGRSEAELLVVEDNPGDARLLEEYLDEAGIGNPVHKVTTVDEALDFLYGRGEFADEPRPDVVFLDWHLPRGTADTIVQQLEEDFDSTEIYTIVLTGSMRDRDSIVPSDLGVDGYLTKPLDTEELLSLVESSGELSLVEQEE